MIETEHGAAHAISQAELLIEVNGVVSVVRLDETSYRVGRAESNQLCFPGIPGLSREHLSLEREGPIGLPAIWAAPMAVPSMESAFPRRILCVPGIASAPAK